MLRENLFQSSILELNISCLQFFFHTVNHVEILHIGSIKLHIRKYLIFVRIVYHDERIKVMLGMQTLLWSIEVNNSNRCSKYFSRHLDDRTCFYEQITVSPLTLKMLFCALFSASVTYLYFILTFWFIEEVLLVWTELVYWKNLILYCLVYHTQNKIVKIDFKLIVIYWCVIFRIDKS